LDFTRLLPLRNRPFLTLCREGLLDAPGTRYWYQHHHAPLFHQSSIIMSIIVDVSMQEWMQEAIIMSSNFLLTILGTREQSYKHVGPRALLVGLPTSHKSPTSTYDTWDCRHSHEPTRLENVLLLYLRAEKLYVRSTW